MIENTILSHLIFSEDYNRKALPFLKEDYFHDSSDKVVFNLIDSYVKKYNSAPSRETLLIELNNIDKINEVTYKKCKDIITNLASENTDVTWLLDTTEKFCQDKAIHNAILKSIQILDEKTGEISRGSIPKILSDALGVSFETSIGHDYLQDTDLRYEFYHKKEDRIEFDLDYFNKITKGGLPRKTLNVILAGTGVGKTLFMAHCAAANLVKGKNVLYITMEMAEERIAERIDANLLNVTVDELSILPKDAYDKKVNRIKEKTVGKLIIKEYPTASAGSANFRHLINELRIKRNFLPDIIYIDYLNICCSSRIRAGSNVNSYTYIKAIAEELRGLAVEFNLPIVSATQTTRSGYSSSDIELTDTSESFGLPATADMMFALVSSEELELLNQLMVKQLKNRYNDPTTNKRFVVGIDRSKMRLYNVEQSAQDNLIDDSPVFDKTKIGEATENIDKLKNFFN